MISEIHYSKWCVTSPSNNSFSSNSQIRRWAIRTATNLGEVDRDDYYDIQEVFTCLFKVIELGLFENPDVYNSAELEEGRLILLPPHLYDNSDYKSYWLGEQTFYHGRLFAQIS